MFSILLLTMAASPEPALPVPRFACLPVPKFVAARKAAKAKATGCDCVDCQCANCDGNCVATKATGVLQTILPTAATCTGPNCPQQTQTTRRRWRLFR